MGEMTMVERAARAICKSLGDDPDESVHLGLYAVPKWRGVTHIATAVIASMQNPNQAMRQALKDQFEDDPENPEDTPDAVCCSFVGAWNFLVDAALAEQP